MGQEVSNDDLINQFADDLKTGGKSRDTVYTYPYTIRAFGRFVGGSLLNITESNLRRYLSFLTEQGFKKSTISRYFVIISEFYKFLIYFRLYQLPNPVSPEFWDRYLKRYKSQSPAGNRKSPSTDEVIKLIDSVVNTRDLAVIVLLFKTGIRRKELSELDTTDVDMDTMTITLKPTTKRTNRIIYFDEETVYVLDRWLKLREKMSKGNNPALFLSKEGIRLANHTIDIMFKKYAKLAGLYKDGKIENKLTPHCCRHWFTTVLFEAGMRSEYVDHLRGDKGKTSASIYHHIKAEKVKEEYLRCIPRFGIG